MAARRLAALGEKGTAAIASGSTVPIRILGVDPGLQCTGYGVVESLGAQSTLLEAGVLRPKRDSELESRLLELHHGLQGILQQYKPHAMAVEQLYSHYDRPRTAILMGHARGVICLAAALEGIPVHHYPSTNIKKILTGNGRAPKEQMQTSVQREFGMAEAPEPHDVADALAAALCHIYLVVRRLGVEMTSTSGNKSV